jgi:hypothetical protein
MEELRLTVGIGLLLVLPACALFGRSEWDPFLTGDERQLRVRVENPTHRDVVVHVLHSGARTRLGRVSARSGRLYPVPLSSTREVRFQVDPVGDRRHTTDAILAGPGEVVELVIQEPASRSFVRR